MSRGLYRRKKEKFHENIPYEIKFTFLDESKIQGYITIKGEKIEQRT